MRRTSSRLMACVLITTGAWIAGVPATASASDTPQLVVLNTATPPAPIPAVAIVIASGATEGSSIVNVRNESSAEFIFGLQARLEGFNPTVTAATGTATNTFTLKKNETIAVKVSVAQVTDNLAHDGELLLEIAGRGLSHLIDLHAQRGSAPADVLVEGASSAGIVRTVTGADYRDTITLLPASATAVPVSVRFSALTGPDGQSYPLDAIHAGSSIDAMVTVGEPFDISLRAQLPRPGEYGATMTMTVASKPSTTVIKVTRAAEALALTIGEPIVPSVDITRSATAILDVLVTSASPVTLRWPSIALKRGSDYATFDAHVSVDGREIARGQTISLVANEPVQVTIRMQDLKAAGAYSGTVSLQADGLSGSAEKGFSFGARRPPLIAFSIIAVGVVVSLLISAGLVRRKLDLQAALTAAPIFTDLDLLGRLQMDPQDALRVESLRGRIEDAQARSEAGDTPDPHAYDGVSVRLKLLRRVVIVASRVDTVDQVIRSTVERSLATVRDFIDTALSDTVPDEVDQAIKDAEELTGVLPGLRAQVADIDRRLKGRRPMFDASKVDELEAEMKSLLGDKPGAAQYTQAVAQMRPGLIDLYLLTLEERAKDAPTHPPDDWPARQTAILEEARKIDRTRSLAEADAHLDAAYALLLKALIAGLDSIPPSKDVKQLLATATRSVNEGLLIAAKTWYDKAVDQYNKEVAERAEAQEATRAKDGATGLLGTDGPEPDSTAVEKPAPGAPPYGTPSPGPATTLPTGRASQLARTLKRNRLAAAVIIGVVATVVGFGLLYGDSQTWGTQKDMVAAFVWGLGLSGATYAGVAGVSDALTGTPPKS